MRVVDTCRDYSTSRFFLPFLFFPFLFSLPLLFRCADTVLNQVRQRDKQVGSGDTAFLGK